MEKNTLKENAVHGTQNYPYAEYSFDGKEDFQVPLHWHKEAEIIFMKEGRYKVTVNAEQYSGEAPAMFFVGSGEIHSLRMERGTVETAVVFSPQILESASYDSIQHTILTPWMEGKLKVSSFLAPGDAMWAETLCLYREIWRAAKEKEIGSYLRLKAGLFRLLASLYEQERMIRIDHGKEEDPERIEPLKKVLGFVRQNYSRRITADEIADVAGMNTQYFCRYFKKHTGRTLTEYVNDVRVSQAARLLAQTQDKILNIAVQCGYENAGYFINRFRRCKGMTPSEYREWMKKSK